MRVFADMLREHFGLTVHLWDERWTSTEANRLLRETDLSIKKTGTSGRPHGRHLDSAILDASTPPEFSVETGLPRLVQ